MSSLINRASALRAMGLRVVMILPRTRVSRSLTQVSSGRRYTAQTVNGSLPLNQALKDPDMIARVVRR